MRISILLLTLFLVACGDAARDADASPAQGALEAGLWTGSERDGICVANDGKAAFIRFGEGDANCMAQGTIENDGDALVFKPRGDDECRIAILQEGDVLTVERGSESCAYYCGSGASLIGEGLRRSNGDPAELRDIAGDRLC
ncbi:MAG: hypothetical protein HKO13_03090 [Sphingomonas sp.]|nr:hypothetical protein [Sphingomonas sp.]RZV49673.1 MAG: hypothetical protein EX258_06860 [Sphingomonadaceae bacterium]